MEHNTDRLGFALIAIAVISIFLFFVNSIYQPSTANMFKGFRDWMQQGNGDSNSNSKFTTHWAYAWSADGKTRFTTVKPTDEIPPFVGKYSDTNASQSSDYNDYVWASNGDIDAAVPITHTAYSWSSDGTDRFTTTKPNLNLVDGTSDPFTMGYGIPNTGWNADKKRSEISLPTNILHGEVLPQSNALNYTVTPGRTYTQSIYVSTDAPLTGNAVQVTWFTFHNGHNIVGKTDMSSISKNVYRITSTYTWPANSTDNLLRTFDIFNLTSVFDFTKGTFLYFYQPKFEEGSTATPYMPSASEVKPSDGPKYIGTYTDINKKQSQDPASYTWKAAS